MASRLSPLYSWIRTELLAGRVIPFLGSGASLTPRTPKDAPWRTQINAARNEWSIAYIPTAGELAAYLANTVDFPDKRKDLAKVAQYFDARLGRGPLNRELNHIFNADYPYSSLHVHLAQVAKHNHPLLIVTTNYDDLIERAFDDYGSPY